MPTPQFEDHCLAQKGKRKVDRVRASLLNQLRFWDRQATAV